MQRPDDQSITKIAQVMHEAVRAWQRANGQAPAPPWARAPAWMKTSSREAVRWRLDNPEASASEHHDQWVKEKTATGWKHGKTKSAWHKTHPLMVSYEELPEVERRKDALVAAVIDALVGPMR